MKQEPQCLPAGPTHEKKSVNGWVAAGSILLFVWLLWTFEFSKDDKPPLFENALSFDSKLVGAPIAPDARITTGAGFTNSKLAAMVAVVRLNGFVCDEINAAMLHGLTSVDLELVCNKYRYSYLLHDKGGQWVVTVE